MSRVKVLLVADEGKSLNELRAECESRGMTEVHLLPRLHTLHGTVDETLINGLAEMPGVRSIERERRIQLAPPKSRLQ